MIRYNLEIFQRYENYEEKLPQKVIDIIDNLAKLVGAPSYVKTPNFKEKQRYRNKKKTDWALIRNFKVTKIERKIEGIENDMNILREFLNKMTEKTFDENVKKIIIKIRTFKDDKKQLMIICKYIFKMASTNKFFSEIYARLYKILVKEFCEMEEECIKQFENFFITFEEIEYINSDEDYDKFCDMNEKNEKRRAMCQFFINLMKKKIIKEDKIINMIILLQEKIFKYLKEKNKQNKIEELVENIFILLYKNKPFFEKNKNWKKIEKSIEKILNCKKCDYPSLTNKIKFRYLDIAEYNE